MDKKIIFEGIGLFVLGALVGGGSVHLYLTKRYEQQLEEEVEQYRRYMRRKDERDQVEGNHNAQAETYGNLAAQYNSGQSEEDGETASVYSEGDGQDGTDGEPVPEALPLFETFTSNEVVEDSSDDVDQYTVISEDEFYELAYDNGWDVQELTYYEDDDTLVDEADNPVFDPSEIIGPDALDSFGVCCSDQRETHIRNSQNNTVYNIRLIHDSYTEAVLGLYEEYKPRVRKMRPDE